MKRIIVARPRPADPELSARPPVGVLAPSAASPGLGLVVKVTFSFARPDAEAARLAPEQEALSLGRAHPSPLASARELLCPSDFVPPKPKADLLLVGHAHAFHPTTGIAASVSALGVTRRIVCVSGEARTRIPLVHACLRAEDGERWTDPVGPLAPAPEGGGAPAASPKRWQSAVRAQRGAYVRADEAVELVGLSPRAGHRVVRLPGVVPRALLRIDEALEPLALAGDTLWIDVDRELAVVTWRGREPGIAPDEVDEILVSLEWDASPRGADALLRALPGGVFEHAGDEERLRRGDTDAGGDDPALMLARHAAWAIDAPEPLIPLETYAAISAELAEGRAPRDDVLRAHRMDEGRWMAEERAWLERMAREAQDGDGSLAARYGELFVAAQDALAEPREAERTLEEYAELAVAMEEAEDPADALREAKMTLAAWMRLDRRWEAMAERDPAVAEALDRHRALARARAAGAAGAERGP